MIFFLCLGGVCLSLVIWYKQVGVFSPPAGADESHVLQVYRVGSNQKNERPAEDNLQSGETGEERTVVLQPVLDPPQNLRVENDSGSIVLEWDVCPQFDEYHIFRGRTRDELQEIAVVKSTIPFYLDTEIEKNVRYYYGIKVKKEDRLSDMSNMQVCSIISPLSPIRVRRSVQSGER